MIRALAGTLLCLLGALWIGQGVGAVPGSFMTGRPEYAVLGAVTALAGIALIVWGLRGRGRRGGPSSGGE